MPLVLTLHKAREPSDRQRESRTVERGRLTIGRGPGNGWVLQDPSRHLSKTHCVVEADGADFRLTDVSSNGVFLNGAPERLPRDRPVAVADGDEFIIGDYLIRVSTVAALTRDAVAACAASAPRGTAPAFAEDDPFGLITPAAPLAATPPGDAARAWHDDPLGAADDDLFPAGPAQDADDSAGDVERTRQISPAALSAAFPELDDLEDLLGDREAAPPATKGAVPGDANAAARVVAAFLAGAGQADLDVSAHDPETYFRMIGELVRTMTESLRDVLVSRTAIKGEFGIEQTMLRARDNNALKFSLGPQDAVAALLQPGRPGYMPPVQAAREAFDDIRLHQLAVMAGVQAALANLLRTFDPAALEARLEKRSMLDNILPAGRRAKLWEAFAATYKDIARDADSDFQSIFGREFNRAYREQMRPP
jgi:type VI secretion system FHA domain protein